MFTVGGDGKIYGGTYGNAKLVSYDPATGKMQDLGRMHRTQMYSRTVVTGKDGRIYIGIGTAEADVIAYDPVTGEHRSILPKGMKSARSASTHPGRDGHAYARVLDRWFRCEDSTMVPVPAFPGPPDRTFRDGRVLEDAGDGYYVIRYPDGRIRRKTFTYRGSGSMVFLVARGPLGRIYGSSIMPLELFEYSPATGSLKDLGNPTPVGGEIYSMATLDNKLYLCAYPGSWLSVYDPTKPWDYGTTEDSNPKGLGYAGEGHLRPRAMVVGPRGLILIGSLPPYGEHGGAMAVFDTKSEKFLENHRNIVPNQGIFSLAYEESTGLVFGGSTIEGGGGTTPIERNAHLFAWDLERQEKVLDIVPVSEDHTVSVLVPMQGVIFGMTRPSNSLFRFDPDTSEVTILGKLPGHLLDLSLGKRRGVLYGLTRSSIFSFDPTDGNYRTVATYPQGIGAGFAKDETAIYFGSGVHLVRYLLSDGS